MGEFFDWFVNHGWAAWGVLAAALAAAELLTLEFTLLMLSAGAAAGALTALLLPGLFWAQALVAIAVAIFTLFVLRPTLLRRTREAPGYRSALESLVGSPGVATAEVTASAGEVKVSGQVWEARAFDSRMRITKGEPIEVYGIDGVTLIVYPSEPQGELTQGNQTGGQPWNT